MTKLPSFAPIQTLPRVTRASVVNGLAPDIDQVAESAAPTHGFLRRQWYAAAIAAYGGRARTLLVNAEDRPVLALPMVPIGPSIAGAMAVPGSYWPFRSFPLAQNIGADVFDSALDELANNVRALRIGPVYDDDAAVTPFLAAARARGWAVLDRHIATSFVLDLAAAQTEGIWPRTSTLRRNRGHEKHLASHGALDWKFLSGADWPDAFDDLAAVERTSWIATRTDGHDAKFTRTGHGAFWRAAAADPVLAAMFRTALLTIDGRPAAFSFDLDAGPLKYTIANSYDPAFAKDSPGKLLSYRNLVDAIGRGISRLDWGAGDTGYKRTVGAVPGPAIRDWLLLRPGLPAALAPAIRRAWRDR